MLVQEVIDEILDVLDVASVTNSGKVRQWSDDEPPELEVVARTVTVTAEPDQDQAVPYARVTATDTGLIPDEEPHGYDYQPSTRVIRVVINVFSDWGTEARAIAAAIEALLGHKQIDTATFRGWTWMEEPARFYDDNTSDPNQVYRVAALVFRAIVQAK
jgi:hypothetical protein